MVTPRRHKSLKSRRSSPSSISSVISHRGGLSTLSSSTHASSKRVHVQQTLLILIHLHLLRRLIKPTLENNHDRTNPQHDALKKPVKVYFQLHAFHADLEHLPKLISLASFFGADLQSVFLHADGTSEIEKFLNYSGIITGLRIELREPSDLEFLNNSSSLFPRLKQLEVEVFERISVSMLLIEALKTNTTVTSLDLQYNSIKTEGARSLAKALKVNTSVTSVNLRNNNSIKSQGVLALAEALKVNHRVEIRRVINKY
ncbi:hypothetical protein GEMRC1_005270 [Eukaryota sp. GEM-RC1]